MFEDLRQLITEQIQSNQFLSGGLALGLIGAVAVSLKAIPIQIWSRVKRVITYTATIDQRNILYFYLEHWLSSKYNESFRNVEVWTKAKSNTPKSEKAYSDGTFYADGAEQDYLESGQLTFKHKSDYFMIFKYGRILKVEKNQEKLEHATSFTSLLFNKYHISGFFAKKAINKLLEDVYEYGQDLFKTEDSVSVYTNFGKSQSWNSINDVKPKSLEHIVLKAEDKKNLINDIDKFVNNREWYEKRAISYKRGYSFYGKPGNGKTSLCLAISHYLKRDIYFLNLSDTDSASLIWLFNRIDNNSILVIEDIDTYFKKRKGKNKANFGVLLNCLDGAFSKESIIVIFTTNHIEKIDPALIREGRIDFKIKMDNPGKAEAEEYCSLFFGRKLLLHGYKSGRSMAAIQDICLKNAETPGTAVKKICQDG